MRKTITVLILVTAVLITFCSCSGSWRESYEGFLDKLVGKVDAEESLKKVDTETSIRDRLDEYSGGNTIWFHMDDFDSDGAEEAFAFVGKAETDYMEGVLWYVNENYAAELKEAGKWQMPEIVAVDGTSFLFSENVDDGLTYVFGVEGSKVYETAVSGMFSHLMHTGGKNFTAEFTSDDYYEDEEKAKEEEPTTKLYWFYLEDGEFHEYGADDTLKRADLREFPTGSDIINEIYNNGLTEGLLKKYYPDADEETLKEIAEEAGYFKNIMKRENGVWNLNFYGAYDDCFYITFEERGNDLVIIDEGRGFYLEAAVPSIATFPVKETEAAQ